jgi:hypothetical protein
MRRLQTHTNHFILQGCAFHNLHAVCFECVYFILFIFLLLFFFYNNAIEKKLTKKNRYRLDLKPQNEKEINEIKQNKMK